MWPTPLVTAGFKGSDPPREGGASLVHVAKTWPTPTAHDAKGQGFDNTNLHNIAVSHHSQMTPTNGESGPSAVDLNPEFVECLMGLPVGWSDATRSLPTASTCSATGSFPKPQLPPGES